MVLFVFPRAGRCNKGIWSSSRSCQYPLLAPDPKRPSYTRDTATLTHCHTAILSQHKVSHSDLHCHSVSHFNTATLSRLLTRDSLSPETLPHQCVTLGFTQSHCVTVCHNETLSHSQETFLQQRRLCHTLLLFSRAAQYQPLADTKWGHNPLLTRSTKWT